MPAPTLTQRVNELTELVGKLSEKVDQVAETNKVGLNDMKGVVTDLASMIDKLKDDVRSGDSICARHDERLKTLEKFSDRVWQLAPIVIAGLALIVAFLKK